MTNKTYVMGSDEHSEATGINCYKLVKCFRNSFINEMGEFIAHKRTNTYFILHNCDSTFDVQCKVLEWISRCACKCGCYKTECHNKKTREFMLNGINEYLSTEFTHDEITTIYTLLGNSIKHDLTIKFVASGYDMNILNSYRLQEESEI